MKLTKYIRQAFVAAAMNDVPSIDYEQQASDLAHKTMRDALQTALGKTKFEDVQDWLNTSTVNLPDHFNNIYTNTPRGHGYSFISEKYPEVWATLKDLSEKEGQQEQTRQELKSKLEGIAASVTTRKALVELLPEFEKYLPAEAPGSNRNLPAIANVLADFVTAGWPKDAVAAS